ncbi:MAG: AraC family transcriptional regulator [Flavobacteriales bacterium]|nr:AraC family transcriptional regulator [Flavobacteriales bacterium]
MDKAKTNSKEYIKRIGEVIQFIHQNLHLELNLAIVAEKACYSPYHFHRIFSAITGESLNSYINRKRIEKSAALLMHHSQKTISDIVFECGFNSNSSYTKAFKKFYGMSPTEFRSQSSEYSKIGKTVSKDGQIQLSFDNYVCNINHLKNWMNMNANIEVKEMPQMKLAYVSHTGPFEQIGEAYGKLMQWAGPKGLLNNPGFKCVTVHHDDPNITEISKVRQSACITLDEAIKAEGEIGYMTTEKVKCAVARFEIDFSEFEQSWQSVFIWLNENGYQTANKDCYEIFHNDFNEHPQKKCILDICVPVL